MEYWYKSIEEADCVQHVYEYVGDQSYYCQK